MESYFFKRGCDCFDTPSSYHGAWVLAFIGFTMSMFATSLAFTELSFHIQAKIEIFAASIIGGFIGHQLLKK